MNIGQYQKGRRMLPCVFFLNNSRVDWTVGKDHTMIKNEYRVTWKMYKSWLSENRLKSPRLVFAIIWIILGLAGAGMYVAYGSSLYLLMVLFCLYRAFLRDILITKRQYGFMARTYGRKDWLRTIILNEEQIISQEGKISVNYEYSDISELKEKDNKVWLIFKNKTVIRMYKDCFVDSDWEGCRSLIERKREASA